MSKSISICGLIVFGGVVIVCAVAAPNVLSDCNKFLRDFVGPEFLGVLGVILAITLASSAQLHLAFNQLEERFRKHGLPESRAAVRNDTYWLIVLFLLAVIVVFAKAAVAQTAEWQSLFNGAALLILVWNVLLLISLTRTVFKIPAVFEEHEEPTDGNRGERKRR